MKIADNMTELIGGTPMVKLKASVETAAAEVVTKLEYFNPGSSVKDRIALTMIRQAEADGSLTKGLPRHPILEDCVTVYSGATILGRVTIGAGSIIGGNIWLTNDAPPGSKITQQHSTTPAATDKLLGGHPARH